ncbi:DUF4124 domain-containing protein [Stenotrophomonas sp.]|uniref:DUF4124 domain-containing protein n=1 Tax=Stenotrophomonas sp. TaxID=69392 RepID=UPI0028AADEEC|nr:DUF4124 domain-containing protein [Stenotrophomonas sp.]
MAGLWGPAHAQVYKCKGAAGEAVYSQNPCGGSAEEVKVRTSRAATRTAGEVANRDAVFRSTDLTDIAIAERNCIASASSSIYGPVNARAADYQRQISALSREAATAKNNLAGATYQAAVRSQISGIQGSMSAERQTADSNMTSARQRCADERRSKEEGVKKAYEARASQPAAAGY